MMRRKWLVILLLWSASSVLAQDEDVIPCSYISRHLKDTITIGNNIMSARIWGEKDGLYLQLDSGKIKIDLAPCIWDFNFRETVNYKDGNAMVENSYVKFRMFIQRDSPALWIKGKCLTPSKISIVKIGDSWPYTITSDGIDGDCRNFTIRISLGRIDFMKYKKAFNTNKMYWNDFWQRSYIKIEGRDSVLSNEYNLIRWQNATSTNISESIRYCIRSGDWDIFKTQILKKEKTLETLNLMMEYFSHSEDESFLHKIIVPMAQDILEQQEIRDTNLYFEVCNRFLDIPPRVILPEDLFETISSVPMNYIKSGQSETIQDMMLNENFPKTWDVRYQLWKEGRQCIRGEFVSGKWKRKPRTIHHDFFL